MDRSTSPKIGRFLSREQKTFDFLVSPFQTVDEKVESISMSTSEWLSKGRVLVHLQIAKSASTSFKTFLKNISKMADFTFGSESGAGPIRYSKEKKVKKVFIYRASHKVR